MVQGLTQIKLLQYNERQDAKTFIGIFNEILSLALSTKKVNSTQLLKNAYEQVFNHYVSNKNFHVDGKLSYLLCNLQADNGNNVQIHIFMHTIMNFITIQNAIVEIIVSEKF